MNRQVIVTEVRDSLLTTIEVGQLCLLKCQGIRHCFWRNKIYRHRSNHICIYITLYSIHKCSSRGIWHSVVGKHFALTKHLANGLIERVNSMINVQEITFVALASGMNRQVIVTEGRDSLLTAVGVGQFCLLEGKGVRYCLGSGEGKWYRGDDVGIGIALQGIYKSSVRGNRKSITIWVYCTLTEGSVDTLIKRIYERLHMEM